MFRLANDSENISRSHIAKSVQADKVTNGNDIIKDIIPYMITQIDTSANFRIGDTAEVELLKTDVIEEVFEQKIFRRGQRFSKAY